jgi:NAD(P)-dependent dehydrogenase (short-subunit alcohol dehydrogenase family)
VTCIVDDYVEASRCAKNFLYRSISRQLAEIYDANVLSTQRVNRAALPILRKQGGGLVIWVGSSSTRGGTPPYLAPYFAAKAGMDAIAVSYAGELARWKIESTIVVPGAFTSGTNHFANAGKPSDASRLSEYSSGPTAKLDEEIMQGFARTAVVDADVCRNGECDRKGREHAFWTATLPRSRRSSK